MESKKVKNSKKDLIAKNRIKKIKLNTYPTIELIMKIVLYKDNENQKEWRRELSYIFDRINFIHLSNNNKFSKSAYKVLFEAYVESEQDYVNTLKFFNKDLVCYGFPLVDIDNLTPQISTLYNNFLALKSEVLQVFTHKSKIKYEFREIIDKYL